MLRGLGLLLVIAALFGVGFVCGWKWQAAVFAGYREDQALDVLVAVSAMQAQRDQVQGKLAALSTRHMEAKQHAEEREQDLLADIESGRRGLSVLAQRCAAASPSGAAGVDDGTVRADLDPAHGARVIRITREGDRAIRALSALQDYVRTVCLADGV